MAYKKGNRHLTKEQFSEGTTIDGSRIDKAIDDVIEAHNEIKRGDMEAIFTSNTITANWQPSKTYLRFAIDFINGQTRSGVLQTDAKQWDWFPFMCATNAESEVFPSDEQPISTLGFTNRYRTKGYYGYPTDAIDESKSRNSNNVETMNTAGDSNDQSAAFPGTTIGGGPLFPAAIIGSGGDATHKLYFTLDIPMYFERSIIITNVSVFGGQEHPFGAYNSYIDTGFINQIAGDGYKDGVNIVAVTPATPSYDAYMPNSSFITAFETNREGVHEANNFTSLPATTGTELPGELYTWTQQNLGNATVQISMDNFNLPENKVLNSVIFSKTDLGDTAHKFNRSRTTTNRGALSGGQILGENQGQIYEDMEPRYSGGTTWGTWIKEDNLNIPVPANTRLHFTVTVKGFRVPQLFDWHIALTYLEAIENG
jgi:hypothetical protein